MKTASTDKQPALPTTTSPVKTTITALQHLSGTTDSNPPSPSLHIDGSSKGGTLEDARAQISIWSLDKAQYETVLNRLWVHGSPAELIRFKQSMLREVYDHHYGLPHVVFNKACAWLAELNWAWSMDFVAKDQITILLECEAGERMSPELLGSLVTAWPKLTFALEYWDYADGLRNYTDEPVAQSELLSN